jgi:hypothetical protein
MRFVRYGRRHRSQLRRWRASLSACRRHACAIRACGSWWRLPSYSGWRLRPQPRALISYLAGSPVPQSRNPHRCQPRALGCPRADLLVGVARCRRLQRRSWCPLARPWRRPLRYLLFPRRWQLRRASLRRVSVSTHFRATTSTPRRPAVLVHQPRRLSFCSRPIHMYQQRFLRRDRTAPLRPACPRACRCPRL